MAGEQATVRVQCTIQTASAVIDGVKFGMAPRAEGESAVYVSEPIPAEQAERLCSIEGFAPFEGDAKTLTAIDEAIVARTVTTQAEESGTADAERSLAEQQQANRAFAEELAAARRRIVDLENKSGDAAVQGLREQVTELTARVTERDQALEAAQAKATEQEAELGRLREANKALGEANSKGKGK